MYYQLQYDSSGNPYLEINGFYDLWDYDPKQWGERPLIPEIMTRMGNVLIPGTPFKIIYP